MRMFRIVCVSAILMLVSLATAKLAVPNAVLGQTEGALDFCAKADPQSAEKYQEKKKTLVQGASEEELADARGSDEYKEAYQSATDEMSKEPKAEVKKTCSAALAGK